MDHDFFKKRVFELYDGELSDVESRTVLAHIEECPDCRRADADWRRIAGLFFRPPRPETSERFVRKVMERLPASAPGRIAGRIAGRIEWPALVLRWLTPALGIGIAAWLLVASLPVLEPAVSTEGLLLAGGPDETLSRWMFLREPPRADDWLGLVLEGS